MRPIFASAKRVLTNMGLFTLTGIPKGNGAGVYTAAVAGTDYQPPPSVTYLADANLTPTIPAGGAEIIYKAGVTPPAGTTYTGITAHRTVASPAAGATAVDGQKFTYYVYDNASQYNLTFDAGYTPVGVSMVSNIILTNGVSAKAVVISGRYSLQAAKWQVLGINYE
jgi:hypothetical protein